MEEIGDLISKLEGINYEIGFYEGKQKGEISPRCKADRDKYRKQLITAIARLEN